MFEWLSDIKPSLHVEGFRFILWTEEHCEDSTIGQMFPEKKL